MKKLEKLKKIVEEHISDEVKIHDDLLKGKRTLKEHFEDTVHIHDKALKKLKKAV
jgi:hypothetical protein